MRSHVAWPVACALLLPVAVHAQRLEPLPVSFRASQQLQTSNAPELMQRGNHGTEGALIGGVTLGVLGYWLAGKGCEIRAYPTSSAASSFNTCNTGTKLVFAGATALVGAGLGYLIGTGYPKYVEQ